jgi:pescadillo protein
VFDCLNARFVLPAQGYRVGEELPPHVSPFTVSISNTKEDAAVVEETKKAHQRIVGYVPQRVHEIRKLVDPNYSAVDPKGKLANLENEYSSDEEVHAALPEMDAADDVSLSGDELEEGTKKVEWRDETVTENVERTKLSALKVRKQREMNLANQPTRENVALHRQERAKGKEQARREETRDSRLKRKVTQTEKQERATQKMRLQVARKKAAKFYKMINGVVQGTQKKENSLEKRAALLQKGKVLPSSDGKTVVKKSEQGRRAKREQQGQQQRKKVANPYSKLPKWVR